MKDARGGDGVGGVEGAVEGWGVAIFEGGWGMGVRGEKEGVEARFAISSQANWWKRKVW